MASRVCWSCGVYAHMKLGNNSMSIKKLGYDYQSTLQAMFICDQCETASVGLLEVRKAEITTLRPFELERLMEDSPALKWLPQSGIGKDFPDVPLQIAAPASEAFSSRSINAYRGAILLARAVVEATAKNKGITKGMLDKKIDAMREAGLISELVQMAAHEIRHIGNDMAHGDFDEEVTDVDADEILNLMDMILDEVYQKPAQVNRLKDAREAKNAK